MRYRVQLPGDQRRVQAGKRFESAAHQHGAPWALCGFQVPCMPWLCSSVWSERRPVTAEVAGSSPVTVATRWQSSSPRARGPGLFQRRIAKQQRNAGEVQTGSTPVSGLWLGCGVHVARSMGCEAGRRTPTVRLHPPGPLAQRESSCFTRSGLGVQIPRGPPLGRWTTDRPAACKVAAFGHRRFDPCLPNQDGAGPTAHTGV